MNQLQYAVPDYDDLQILVTRAFQSDSENCGKELIGFEDFVNIFERCCDEFFVCDPDIDPAELSDESIKQLFDAVTPGRNMGFGAASVSARELKQVMLSIGMRPLSAPKVRAIVSFFDVNNDGRLEYNDFYDMMRSLADIPDPAGLRDPITSLPASDGRQLRVVVGDEERVAVEEENIRELLQREGALENPQGVIEVQDMLLRRFEAKYEAFNTNCNEDMCEPGISPTELSNLQRSLLIALRAGDIQRIRASIRACEDWNFVFPPAKVLPNGQRVDEGWCRSPLALLCRPDEGSLQNFMTGVSKKERLELIEEALKAGCADPNYPRWYWSCPAAHCCFEGDVEALTLLYKYGCDLEQRIEWVLQPEPRFSLVHAAAFNGNKNVLEFLRPRVLPCAFKGIDAEGSTPLHTLLESSRDMESANFLIQMGVDGFSKNFAGRTPLSIAIEDIPEVAEKLLETKSRFEYRWWGEDLYWYSFDGIVLPCTNQGRAMPVTDRDGKQTTIEGLIVRHRRRELLNQPVMRTLIDRKWVEFADGIYQRRVLQYVLMVLGVFVASAADSLSPQALFGDALWVPCWAAFLYQGTQNMQARGGIKAAFDRQFSTNTEEDEDVDKDESQASDWEVRKVLNAVDMAHLICVPLVPVAKFLVINGLAPPLFTSAVVPLASTLQITLSIRMLQYFSLFKALGPLLVTVVTMFQDIFGFFGLFSFVLFGFTNGFYVTFAMGGAEVEYPKLVETQLLWLLGSIDIDFFDVLSSTPVLQNVAFGLFWTYAVLSIFVFLNLLIAIFNSTYERVDVDREAEWLWLRLEAMLDFETSPDTQGLDEYYTQLESLNNQRGVNYIRKSE